MTRLRNEFFWIGCGQVFSVLGSIVGIRLLTDVLSPASYGELALVLTGVTLVQQSLLGPISQAAMRFLAYAQEIEQLHSYLRAVLLLLLRDTFVVLIILGFLIGGLWVFGFTKWMVLTVLASIFSLIDGYSSILDGIQNVARHRITVALHQGFGQLFRFIFAFVFVILFFSSSEMVIFGYIFSSLLFMVSRIIFFVKKVAKNDYKFLIGTISRDCVENFVQRMRKYANPFAIWGIFTWAQLSSDRWALQFFETTNSVGLYAVLYQIGFYPITLLVGLVVQLAVPMLFSLAGDASDSLRLDRTHRLNYLLFCVSVILAIVATIFAFIFHKYIFSIIASSEYSRISWLLPFMVLAGGTYGSGQIIALLFMSSSNTEVLLAPKIYTSIICVLLNFIGAYFFDVFGVVLANVVFSLIYLIWMLVLARMHMFKRTYHVVNY
jgi:O-antigen/teichoic acid export membrane protein